MVDSPDIDWDDLYKRAQSAGKETQSELEGWLYRGKTYPHKIKYGTKKGEQQYRTVTSQPMSSGVRSLAKELAKPNMVREDIEKQKYFKTIDIDAQFGDIYNAIDDVRIDSQEKELKDLADKKKREIMEESFRTRGKLTTLFRERIKETDSISKVMSILSDAKDEIGEGKNYQSLVKNAEIRIDELGGVE